MSKWLFPWGKYFKDSGREKQVAGIGRDKWCFKISDNNVLLLKRGGRYHFYCFKCSLFMKDTSLQIHTLK